MLFMEYHRDQCMNHYFFYYILIILIAPQKMGYLFFLRTTSYIFVSDRIKQ